MAYDELGLYWLDGDGSEVDIFDADFDIDEGEDLEDIFGDIVKGVGKIVTAPVDLVAKALPKPLRKPFEAVHQIASPTHMLGLAAQGRGPLKGTVGVSASGTVGGRARATTRRPIISRKPSVSMSRVMSAGAGDRDDLLKTMVKVLGAKDIIKTAAATKPRLAAKSTGKDSAGADAGRQALIEMVANAVGKKLGPDLSAINKRLRLAENQRMATSEHLAINNTAAFRRKVLQDLMRMSMCLPSNNPTRQKIRRIGLMSGLV